MSERTRLVDLDPADRKARCGFCGKERQRVAGMVERRIDLRQASSPRSGPAPNTRPSSPAPP